MQVERQTVIPTSGTQPKWHYTPKNSVTAMSTKPDFSILPMEREDKQEILKFLKRLFFKDEPLNVSVKLCAESNDCPELEEYCASIIEEEPELCLKALSKEGRLLGVCLNGTGMPGYVEQMRKNANECPNPRFAKILKLLTRLEAECGIYEKFNTSNVLEIRILSVDNCCRGQGVATSLISRSCEIAVEKGFDYLRCDCTSEFSAKAVAKLGFYPIYHIQFREHLGEDNLPVFQPEHPHTQASTYVKAIKKAQRSAI